MKVTDIKVTKDRDYKGYSRIMLTILNRRFESLSLFKHEAVESEGFTLANLDTTQEFPNGFESWQETHFEVTAVISHHCRQEPISSQVVRERHEGEGTGGMYELAKELTNEFETLNVGRSWDGDFFDEIDDFLTDRLK